MCKSNLNRFLFLRDVWTHKISLAPSFFIEVPLPSQEIVRSCMLGVSILPLSPICLYDFGTIPLVIFDILIFQTVQPMT
jgi:hypothetical protein